VSIDAPVQNAFRQFANRIALIDGKRRWTFAELARLVNAVAGGLSQALEPGSRVGLFMKNRAEYLILQLALEHAGLVRVPLNALYTAHEVEKIIADSEAAAVFLDAACEDKVAGLDRAGIWLCNVEGSASGGPDWKSLTQASVEAPPAHDDLDALCSINYTSGSSGQPKGVMLTHRNWRSVTKNMLIDRDIRGSDRLAHIGPLTHASGTYFMPFFLRGATNIIVNGNWQQLLTTIEHEKVTAFSCVPTVLTRILNSPDIERHDTMSLRWIGYGAEAIQPTTLDKAVKRWGPILTHNYGLTEAMMTCTRLRADDHFQVTPDGSPALRHGCIGSPYTFVDIVLREPDGTPVKDGQTGEITIRAEHVMQGYWKRPRETAEVLKNGWLWSGDLAKIGPDGLIYLVGRSKEMLISGGFNIYPREIESCLSGCPGVEEAAVIGVPDREFGEIAVAFVVASAGHAATASTCEAHCKPILGFRTPKRWHFLSALPRTGNGKVDKNALKNHLNHEALNP
jgi:acyl-CoA synthetase (AMP-forming)/AMP-acid ligase II